ncbi:toxin glutamine deamidase domain-containing protein [Actinacidiphila sp. DG2A-62]|uniref:toxin glutamine deamidase domain-containing protein n=1 Tax=Actinacidiphila sp. DG2A-62 TaxID=3108821 RepID=UPI002DBC5284|nr:toxin glutamine deamidase domain-containing protein [Actinacidiphila sp. DG2A-62]MEC3993781.1 toxin glutamine deamidase domain-containing protein [Actinacidiphila sp. DG2A-62]
MTDEYGADGSGGPQRRVDQPPVQDDGSSSGHSDVEDHEEPPGYEASTVHEEPPGYDELPGYDEVLGDPPPDSPEGPGGAGYAPPPEHAAPERGRPVTGEFLGVDIDDEALENGALAWEAEPVSGVAGMGRGAEPTRADEVRGAVADRPRLSLTSAQLLGRLRAAVRRVAARSGGTLSPNSCLALVEEVGRDFFPQGIAPPWTTDDRVLGGRGSRARIAPGEGWTRPSTWGEVTQALREAGPNSTAFILVQRPNQLGHAFLAHSLPRGPVQWIDLQPSDGRSVATTAEAPDLPAALAQVLVVTSTGRTYAGSNGAPAGVTESEHPELPHVDHPVTDEYGAPAGAAGVGARRPEREASRDRPEGGRTRSCLRENGCAAWARTCSPRPSTTWRPAAWCGRTGGTPSRWRRPRSPRSARVRVGTRVCWRRCMLPGRTTTRTGPGCR